MGLLIDGSIVVVYFVAIVFIGLRMGKRENSLHDFALGGRNVPWWAVMASIIAAETSAATFLGAPGEGFDKRSLAYVQLVFGVIIGRFIIGNVFLEPYYRYKVYTVYDYIGVRFGPVSKNYVSALFLLMRTLASGARLFVPSLVMVLAWQLFSGGGRIQFSQQAVTSVGPYLIAIVALTVVTCIYTALGGIKAVIWTDVIQTGLMFGGALIAMFTLLSHVGGLGAVARAVPQMTHLEGYFLTGFEPDTVAKWQGDHNISAMNAWEYVKLILGSDYTVFSALVGTTFLNMAAFGTDQDMVQRMLTAETHQKARRSLLTAAFMDLPIAAVFTFIGILLYVYYGQDPTFKPVANSDVFGSYILNVMPVGIRGLVLAGVFATAMGSLSAALNSLATSATNDWYLRRVPGRGEDHYVKVAKIFTAVFAVLMVLVAGGFAYAKVHNPDVRIIPVVLGIAGFILGPMLGVFLIGMFTKNRGSDKGNVLAVTLGLMTTVVMGDLHIAFLNAIAGAFGHPDAYIRPDWLPKISFTWFAMIGALVVFAVGACFKTPAHILEAAERKAAEANENEARPLAMRDEGA
ncbi:transporter, SSS family [Abditibacterium utsteinense]|uniref:Transporter, SSS family n=1 Tax=Abditibacterium utsteinense TaxID=1960156 RepID=A0A2S8SQM3_9BACT|nr:sodium:solute symporter [Abditibacterium utsteinense]PQV63086.1 transporter, SSS family [Abditibacterium utsteinense]